MMRHQQYTLPLRPAVRLVGEMDHPEFAEAVALVRAADIDSPMPELIVVVESRPNVISPREIERLRRELPLVGIVMLVGSWCEGEPRTGRPAAGVPRLYWYEFPAWWRRQLELRAAGWCPEWARSDDFGLRIADCGLKNRQVEPLLRDAAPLVAVCAPSWNTKDAVRDALAAAGFTTVWHRGGEPLPENVAAGIWDGGQLSDAETADLAGFCLALAARRAPVVALLDFPRRDRCQVAKGSGAAAVLGKPWHNRDLVETLQQFVGSKAAPKSTPAQGVA